jgi:hypothetical protein
LEQFEKEEIRLTETKPPAEENDIRQYESLLKKSGKKTVDGHKAPDTAVSDDIAGDDLSNLQQLSAAFRHTHSV